MPDFKFLFDSLSDPNVRKVDYDKAIAAIEKQAFVIWKYICRHRNFTWADFDNDTQSNDYGERSNGFFAPASYFERLASFAVNTVMKLVKTLTTSFICIKMASQPVYCGRQTGRPKLNNMKPMLHRN